MIGYSHINDLQKIAKNILCEEKNQSISDDVKENELSWNSSLFISKILLNSQQILRLDKNTFENEIVYYNKQNKTAVKSGELERKYWVRYIFDDVKIPNLVFSFCRDLLTDLTQQEKYKNEIFYDELMFLTYLSQKYGYEDSRFFKIRKSDFEKIYDDFKNIYTKIKTISEITKLFEFQETEDQLYYKYLPFHIRNIVLNDKVAYYVWKYLSSNNSDLHGSIKKWILLLEQFWTSEFIDLLTNVEKDKFIENCIKLLLQEEDLLLDEKNESYKLICDLTDLGYFEKDIFLNTDKKLITINFTDYFLMWITDESIDFGYDLLSQHCRKLYLLVLHILLNCNGRTKYIYKILSDKQKRPYLFSHILYTLKNNHPEDLLNFINEEDYGVVFYISFIERCFEKINLPQNELLIESIVSLIKKTIDIFIDQNFRSYPFKYKQFCRVLMWLERFNTKIANTQRTSRQKIWNIKKEIYDYHKDVLHRSFIWEQKYDFLQLINIFNDEKEFILPNHIGIFISQFSYLFSILDIAKNKENNDAIKLIVNEINFLYEENIIKSKKLFITYGYAQLEMFNWNLFYSILFENNEIENFVNKTLNSFIVSTGSEYNNFYVNRTNADRFKLLLKTLCLASDKTQKNNMNEYEKLILYLLPHCFKDDKNNKSINIFSSLYESSFDGNNNISVFPLLAKISKNFSNNGRLQFISLVLKNGNFSLLFKAHNLITFSEGHDQIEKFIRNTDFSSKVEEIYTIPEFLETVIDVTNSKINDEFENILFEELNKIISEKAQKGYISEYTYEAELLKLFHLYKMKDYNSLKSYRFPFNDDSRSYCEYKRLLESDKLFYMALLDVKNDKYQEAFNTMNIICKNSPANMQYQIHRIYIKSFILEGNENLSARQDLLKEIESFEKKEIQNAELLLFTKLKIYILNNDCDLALYFYKSLDDNLKKDIGFAYLIIKELLNNNKPDLAFDIFNKIDLRFNDTKEYDELKMLIPTDSIIPKLQNSYSSILTLNPEKRFMILPESINEHNQDIGEYLLNEIKLALHRILKKIDLMQKISSTNLPEDNISDLLELEINGRLSMIGYTLENQDRSGKSSSGINAGEIDLELNINDFSIVIEAVKYTRGRTERIKHIEKAFKYDPSKKYIFNLVYFNDNLKDFNISWVDIKYDIEQAVYPSGFEKISTIDLPSNNAGIKIAKSKHKNELTYYHIMANFTYTDT